MEERKYRDYMVSQPTRATPKNFDTNYTKNAGTSYIRNYVSMDPSEPPVLHKYREQDKSKWIGGKFFV
jgi:hypothetical protein